MMAVNVIPKAKTWTQRFERKTGVDEAVEFERNLGTVPVDVTTARYFFDIEIEGEKTLRLIFELFWSITPKTCRNFAMLCTGECGTSPTETALHYKGSRIHRVVAGQLIQGGDITCGNGRGGESIYGATFDDENFICKHNAPGLLSMANNGPNTNNSMFVITLGAVPRMDGKNTVFGRVVNPKGLKILERISKVPCFGDRPQKQILVVGCGEVREEKMLHELQARAEALQREKAEREAAEAAVRSARSDGVAAAAKAAEEKREQVVKALGVAEENKKRKSAIAIGQPAKRPFLDALDVSDSDDEAESE